MLTRINRLLLFLTLFCVLSVSSRAQFLSTEDVNQLPSAAPDHQVAYGDDQYQIANLRIPDADGPHPVVVVIHGGCWLSKIASFQNLRYLPPGGI